MSVETVGQRALAAVKLTQEEIAEEIGVSQQAVSRWKAGKSRPTFVFAMRLAKTYGISLEAWTTPAPALTPKLRQTKRVVRARPPVSRDTAIARTGTEG